MPEQALSEPAGPADAYRGRLGPEATGRKGPDRRDVQCLLRWMVRADPPVGMTAMCACRSAVTSTRLSRLLPVRSSAPRRLTRKPRCT